MKCPLPHTTTPLTPSTNNTWSATSIWTPTKNWKNSTSNMYGTCLSLWVSAKWPSPWTLPNKSKKPNENFLTPSKSSLTCSNKKILMDYHCLVHSTIPYNSRTPLLLVEPNIIHLNRGLLLCERSLLIEVSGIISSGRCPCRDVMSWEIQRDLGGDKGCLQGKTWMQQDTLYCVE